MVEYADIQEKSLVVAKVFFLIGMGLLLLMCFFAIAMFMSFAGV